jgi:phosphoribosylaminoimidazolecarboxamide formyltransferase/IMP cyclohydrolase
MSTRPLALISVYDKTGVADFARGLAERGYEILSTGGTRRAIEAAGVAVTPVSAFTGAPELFSGRVKTLHPMVHGGILARAGQDEAESERHGVRWIAVVAVNLYPFEATVSGGAGMDEAMENVDIGGPCMVRAAAKNHARVTVVTDPADYPAALEALDADNPALRARLAVKAFRHTAAYDAVISSWLTQQVEDPPELTEGALPLRRIQALRYGENPHQQAAFYAEPLAAGRSLARATQLQGKALSYNNLSDLDGCLRAAFDFEGPACVISKHGNPCGAATHPASLSTAYELALSADPVSAFGSIVAFNRPIGAEEARAIGRSRLFIEVLAAPGVTDEAREIFARRKNMRLMLLPDDWAASRPAGGDARRVQGGWLLQDWDLGAPVEWRVVTKRAPTDAEAAALRFGWRAVRHVKSNAIAFAKAVSEDPADGVVLNGVGAGQMSRVDAVKLAVMKATREVQGSIMASDAFFPFPDGPEAAAQAGITAIIQPGGSVKDDEVTAAADAAGLAMVMTGSRHFRH